MFLGLKGTGSTHQKHNTVVLYIQPMTCVIPCVCDVAFSFYTCVVALRAAALGDHRGPECTYETIEDYHTVPSSTRKNQYELNKPLPTSRSRPESPYQNMKSADASSSSNQKVRHVLHDPLAASHYTMPPSAPLAVPKQLNTDMHVTPGGGVVYLCRGSGGAGGEDMYMAMDGAGTRSSQQEMARLSVTLPDNTLPYNGQVNGEYRLSIC